MDAMGFGYRPPVVTIRERSVLLDGTDVSDKIASVVLHADGNRSEVTLSLVAEVDVEVRPDEVRFVRQALDIDRQAIVLASVAQVDPTDLEARMAAYMGEGLGGMRMGEAAKMALREVLEAD